MGLVSSSVVHRRESRNHSGRRDGLRRSRRLASISLLLAMATDNVKAVEKHASDAGVQIAAEATILAALGGAVGTPLIRGARFSVGAAHVRPDGVAADKSVFVEVFAHIGKLKGSQRHKVSTDALKLLAIRADHSDARLILAFGDQAAAASVSGWRAETLKANGIEIHVVDLSPDDRAKIEAAQAAQKMINPPPIDAPRI